MKTVYDNIECEILKTYKIFDNQKFEFFQILYDNSKYYVKGTHTYFNAFASSLDGAIKFIHKYAEKENKKIIDMTDTYCTQAKEETLKKKANQMIENFYNDAC